MVDHDGGYKRLFSEPRMMQDLLTEIPLRWRGICIPDIEHISDDLEGEARGILEGEARGILEGKTETRQDVARRMKAYGMDLQTIAELTDLSIDDINNL